MKPVHKSEHKLSASAAALVLTTMLLLCYAASSSAKEVSFGWSPNSEEIIGYKLYYKTGTDGSPPYDGTGINEGDSPIVIGEVSTITVSGLSDTETYHFVLTAYNSEEESGFSDIATIYPEPVPVILDITITH